jgi:malate dehydrogenase (oxaloacetate-decarboxylating)
VNWNGREVPIDQTNNSYIFPGMGLGILSVDARRVTDTMFMAAAKCLAELSPARLSKVGTIVAAGFGVALGVIRRGKGGRASSDQDGVADPLDEQTLESRIRANVWEPVYLPYRFNPSA